MIGCVALIGLESLTKRGMPALEKNCGLIDYQCKSDEKLVSRICLRIGRSSIPRSHQPAQTAHRHAPEHDQETELPRKKPHRRQVDRRRERREVASTQREKRHRKRAKREQRANSTLEHTLHHEWTANERLRCA